jgi:ankyrin repeat protein
MYQAVIDDDAKRIEKLLKGGLFKKPCDINGADTDQGFTPLHRAVENKRKLLIRRLIKFGADVNIAFGGTTALDLANRWGDEKVIKWLRDAGGLTHAEIKSGVTAQPAEAAEGGPSWEE